MRTCSLAWTQRLIRIAAVCAVLDPAMNPADHMVEARPAKNLCNQVILKRRS